MKSILFVVLFSMISLSAQARMSMQEYNSIINFVKLNAEWSYFDEVLEVQELTVINQSTLSLRRVSFAPLTYEVRAEVLNLDDENDPMVGEIVCTVQVEKIDGVSRVDQFKSDCQCLANFVCGEREGRLFEE
jgi:hypothetical protein